MAGPVTAHAAAGRWPALLTAGLAPSIVGGIASRLLR
jgi:hypothetical protein